MCSCSEDFLTLDPQATLFSSEYFRTPEEVEGALISAYDILGQSKGANRAFAPPVLISEVLSDDAYGGGQDAGDGTLINEFNTFNFSTTNDMLRSLWVRGYFGIYRTNFTIEKFDILKQRKMEIDNI